MEEIQAIINFFTNLSTEKIVDILVAIIIVIIFSLFSSVLSYAIIKLFKMKEKNKKKIKENAFYKPLKTLFIATGIYLGVIVLKLPDNIMILCYKAFKITIICITASGLANVFVPESRIMKKIGESNRLNGNKTLVNFGGKILKYVIYIAAGFLIVSELGYNLNGLVAGLGLGGVIVALAAQDLAKNLFGGVAIILDKPFIVGDWIQTGKYEGTVEDITFRSTRIRTAENTVVTVQNATISNESLVNYANMTQRRYSFNIKLPLQINKDVIETVMSRIRFVLKNNKDIIEDSVIVEFNTITEDGINIIVIVYTHIIPYAEYLSFRTKVNSSILQVMESESIQLAYPAQSIYLMSHGDVS